MPLSDIDKVAFAEALSGLQIGARRGMEKAGEISFAQWKTEQKEPTEMGLFLEDPEKYKEYMGFKKRGAKIIDDKGLRKRRKIMNLIGELKERKKDVGDIYERTPNLAELAITPPTAKEMRKDSLAAGRHKFYGQQYKQIVDKEKRIKEIMEQIRMINLSLSTEQQIDIEAVLETPQVQEFATIEEAVASNLPVGTEITIQGRQAIIE